ncbi:MAG: scbA [Frankiales bacterium]|nr:scbA [Frankiales bacterium]
MRRLLLGLAVASAVTAGCSSSGGGGSTVLASAYPFAWAAEQVAGSNATVTDLVKPGAEPHDIELSPRQVASFQDAYVVVYLHGFQAAVDDAVSQAPKGAVLDLTSVVDVKPPDSGLTEATSSGADPHVWLDPLRMRAIVDAIASRLASRDPSHAADYRQRAASTDAKLVALDALLRQSLQHCARTDIVTSHTAFAYLSRRYGLHQVGIAGLSPDGEPSPGRLAQVAQFARAHHVTTIFFESLVDPKLAKTVASEVGAKTAVLDPVEGVKKGDDYLSVMRRNAAELHTALGCA